MKSDLLLVKNMVCNRCIATVENILKKLSIPVHHVLLGEIHLEKGITPEKKKTLSDELSDSGFELIDNHIGGLVEKIKHLVISHARNEIQANERKINVSKWLSQKLNYDYSYLSTLFSSVEGRTIENFYIEQRIEKAKELIVYGQKTLSEIAYELDYSSTAHLSAQFKKVTGLTPSHFREIGSTKRKSLDQV
jgi:AraC-like DNA-binding protein